MKAQKIIVLFGICAFFAGLPALTTAQQTGQSLGAAARKVKEQEKNAPKAKMIWTNDNLPTSASVSVVGKTEQQENATSTNESQAAASSSSDAQTLSDDLAQANADLAENKKELDSLKTDLNIAQREYKLDSDQHYSMPNYGTDQQGQAKLDADKNKIDAKQQAVEAAQKKIDALQKEIDALNEKLKGAGAPAPKS